MNSSKNTAASPVSVRRHNRGLVMRKIFEAGTVSRSQIASSTGLTGAAISRITRELLDAGLIEEGASIPGDGRPGRRSVELSLPTKGVHVIGIGAGAFEQWVRISNFAGNVLARRELKLVGLNGQDAIDVIVDAIHTLQKEKQFQSSRLIACGVAIAGVVDPATGVLVNSPNFGWRDLPISESLQDALGVSTKVESLHHALNLTEASLGRTIGVKNILLVNAALGIGASIFANGRLIRGNRTAAGQIGHMRVDGASEICTCGRRGCLDTVASGHSVLTRLRQIEMRSLPREHGPKDAEFMRNAMDSAAAGDQNAIEAFREAGMELGKALVTIKMVTDPEYIVLAGPLAQVESFVTGTRDALYGSAIPDEEMPAFVVSDQQSDAAGAWLALENLVFSEQLDPRFLQTVA